MRLHPNRTAARSATAMWLTEGLVQIVVYRVETHTTGVGLAEDGVEVGAVVVHLTACRVDYLGCR